MAQLVNPCLKRTFTVFNVFFAIVGGGAILLAVLCNVSAFTSSDWGDYVNQTTCLIILYVMGSIIMVTAILGACGAHNESKASLIVFLVFMIIGFLVMLRTGIFITRLTPEVERGMDQVAHDALPLDKASEDKKNMTGSLQEYLHCCGLYSYEDWEGNIPDSCLCNPKTEGECQIVYDKHTRMQKSIYNKPCIPILKHYVMRAFKIGSGVVFTLAALALMGLILSSTMIHQMRYINRPHIMVSVPAIFTSVPPKYQELYNSPAY